MLRTTSTTAKVLRTAVARPATSVLCRAASTHAISKPTLANIEKRWEGMPLQEQAELWMALRDRMKENWAELTLHEKKAGELFRLRKSFYAVNCNSGTASVHYLSVQVPFGVSIGCSIVAEARIDEVRGGSSNTTRLNNVSSSQQHSANLHPSLQHTGLPSVPTVPAPSPPPTRAGRSRSTPLSPSASASSSSPRCGRSPVLPLRP